MTKKSLFGKISIFCQKSQRSRFFKLSKKSILGQKCGKGRFLVQNAKRPKFGQKFQKIDFSINNVKKFIFIKHVKNEERSVFGKIYQKKLFLVKNVKKGCFWCFKKGDFW